MSETREVLEKAAEIVSERGWTRGRFLEPTTGAVCLAGALMEASGARKVRVYRGETEWWTAKTDRSGQAHALYLQAACRLQHRMASETKVRGISVLAWNDAVCQSQEEAVLELKRAAEEA